MHRTLQSNRVETESSQDDIHVHIPGVGAENVATASKLQLSAGLWMWRTLYNMCGDFPLGPSGHSAMCELRKHKWLSHRYSGRNFWLSITIWLSIHYEDKFWLQIYGCHPDNPVISFGCLAAFLVVPGEQTICISTMLVSRPTVGRWHHCGNILALYSIPCMSLTRFKSTLVSAILRWMGVSWFRKHCYQINPYLTFWSTLQSLISVVQAAQSVTAVYL